MANFVSLPKLLAQYEASEQELIFKNQFSELLKHPRAFHRDHLPGHITASAWVLNETHSKVLFIHHAKLNRWLQPGGHADGDENVLTVALRELEEETGIRSIQLRMNGIFDIDIHPIPARKDFVHHDHYDVRFAFMASETEPLLINEESYAVQWVPLHELEKFTSSQSILRMAQKSKNL